VLGCYLRVDREARLGDLRGEMAGVEPARGQVLADVVDEHVVMELAGTDVDRHPDEVPALLPVLRVRRPA